MLGVFLEYSWKSENHIFSPFCGREVFLHFYSGVQKKCNIFYTNSFAIFFTVEISVRYIYFSPYPPIYFFIFLPLPSIFLIFSPLPSIFLIFPPLPSIFLIFSPLPSILFFYFFPLLSIYFFYFFPLHIFSHFLIFGTTIAFIVYIKKKIHTLKNHLSPACTKQYQSFLTKRNVTKGYILNFVKKPTKKCPFTKTTSKKLN